MSFVGIILRVTTNCDVTTAQAQLPKFVLQRLPVHTQNLSSLGYISLRMFETAGDVAAFKLSTVLAKLRGERNAQTTIT